MGRIKLYIVATSMVILLNGCAFPEAVSYNVSHSFGAQPPQTAPSITHETRKVGNPYKVLGRWYYPLQSSDGYSQRGVASWYGTDFHGKKTANGEKYNMYAYTAAHKTLPLPTYARVTNTNNGRSIVVRINDRGPFVKDRLIDMSYAGAKALGMDEQGTAPVLVEAISVHGGSYGSEGKPEYLRKPHVPDFKFAEKQNNYNKPSSFTSRIYNDRNQTQQVNNNVNQNYGYFIQLGAFKNMNNAQRLLFNAKDIPDVKISTVTVDGQVFHRVLLDNIQNINQAESKLEQLHLMGYNNAVIRRY